MLEHDFALPAGELAQCTGNVKGYGQDQVLFFLEFLELGLDRDFDCLDCDKERDLLGDEENFS